MGDAIREPYDDYQDPRGEFLVEYQEEIHIGNEDIQLEAGIPQDTANKNLCKHTQDTQTFLVTPTKGMEYMHGTARMMTVCFDNPQNPFINEGGANFSIVAKHSLNKHFQNWEKQLLPTKAKKLKIESGKMKAIGKIIKEIVIAHRKGNIRLNPEFACLMMPIYRDSYWEKTTKACMALIFATVRAGTLL
ncbi:hypothetical protein O181_102960 [Austropuccinia psidii MF-1]|uniref:Uncharacterized protein n=1 Tax=Austropuccinia psidii MF-1 TaxID=1389203 RepID=A0A9Q3JKL2_9BASI|nr:hypothetical protein [Austropuccinia psidii MF-1]